ncbi:dihydrorhizobitoxine desaturase [Micromonospora qiuiae]|uniref:Dihydrorhizobitoxine desaturase n=1 Tax=Micromonospora qiuiae TaxID=502268 RepID=A0ABQ4JF00_9ACTN|nr:fatty acid desaturase family protein [Micromonospora qiuiae]GIJ28778.1 dihydrorhizobitoxine desaturase [Micromonospora qiuiae]
MGAIVWAYEGKRYTMYRFSPDIEREIKELNKSDNWHALLAWSTDIILIVGYAAACHLISWWLYPVAVLVIGARQRGLSTILHDCAHGVGASDKRLQMVLGTVLTAYPIFQTHYAYKISHVFTHHPKLGNPDGDPDLQFFVEEKVYTPASRARYIGRVLVWPALGRQTVAYLRYLVRNRYLVLKGEGPKERVASPVQRRKERLDVAAFWMFWAAVTGFCWHIGALDELLLFWVIPFLTSFQILGWYIELSEHTPLVRDHTVDLYMTRNRKSRGLEKWLTGIHNDNYHLEHHLDPRTPFWNLHKAREIRLRDPNYAALDAMTGGLFTKGPQGQPSALATIIRMMNEPATADRTAETHRAAA